MWDPAGPHCPLVFNPGSSWIYGTNIDWAGTLLERLTDQSLGVYMRENIFLPLGMVDTTFSPEDLQGNEEALRDRTASFAYRDPDTGTLRPGPSPVHIGQAGGAGLYSTAEDYGRFLHGLIAGELLGTEAMEMLFAPQLNGEQRAVLHTVTDMFRDAFAPEFPDRTEVDHALGGMVNLEHVKGKRRKGSMMWSGMYHSHWVSMIPCLYELHCLYKLNKLTQTSNSGLIGRLESPQRYSLL
jgi:CubicO group peptidase (beta-lactamase class C family)